jgi:O-antigen biosynthesis protein WbqV
MAFISPPDGLCILRVPTVRTLTLVMMDVAPTVKGAFFPGKNTIVIYWLPRVRLGQRVLRKDREAGPTC